MDIVIAEQRVHGNGVHTDSEAMFCCHPTATSSVTQNGMLFDTAKRSWESADLHSIYPMLVATCQDNSDERDVWERTKLAQV